MGQDSCRPDGFLEPTFDEGQDDARPDEPDDELRDYFEPLHRYLRQRQPSRRPKLLDERHWVEADHLRHLQERAYRGRLGAAAKRLIDLRRAETIKIEGADQFFQELAEKVSVLEELDRPHLMSVKMAVEAEKKYLEEEKYRIRLHDLVMGETGRLLSAMADKNFPTNIQVSKEALWGRLAAYEAMSETVIRCRAIFERRYARSGHIFSWTLEELLTSK